MSLGNIWIHPHAQFDISKPTLAFIQMPQHTVNTAQNSVAVCQYPFNIPSTTLSKRSNPYGGLDSVEKKLKVPETTVLAQGVPPNALNHIHSPPMVSFQGFDQSLASKPQGYQQIHSWKALENINTGGYIQIVPQNILTQVYQQVGGQAHQLGGNPVIINNTPNQLGHLRVQMPAPTSQAYVIAEQANWNFTGNYIGHQNVQILNPTNSNFGFQQIQLPSSQNIQAVVLPSNAILQNRTKLLSQSYSMMSTGSFHQVKNRDGVKITKRVVASRKDLSHIKDQQNKSEKEQNKKIQEGSPEQKQVIKLMVANEKQTQGLENHEKKDDKHCSAFLKKRKNWKRVENKLGTELCQIAERKNTLLTLAESEDQAKTISFFEGKPIGKNSLNSKSSATSVDSAELTTSGYKSSPSQDETPCS